MRLFPLFLMLALTASGCGIVESKKIDYKSANKLPTLEVPPDLQQLSREGRYQQQRGTISASATISPGSAPT